MKFRDPQHEAHYGREGYVKVPLLSPEQVSSLLDLYHRVPCECHHGFYTSLWSSDLEYRRAVDLEIRRTLQSRIDELIEDYRMCVGNFAVKRGQDDNGVVPMHQDWSMVDETRHRSMTIWCPLIDVDQDNGCLGIVPRSHRFSDNIRPNGTEAVYQSPFQGLETMLFERYLREFPLPAGEGLIYDSATLHASRINRSPHPRVAIVVIVIPQEAELRHYFRINADEIEVFEVGEDFFWRDVVLTERPDLSARKIGVLQGRYEPVSAERIHAIMSE